MPTALYGAVLLLAAVAYYLVRRSSRSTGALRLAAALGSDFKGKLVVAVRRGHPAGVRLPWLALAIYVVRRAHLARSRPAYRARAAGNLVVYYQPSDVWFWGAEADIRQSGRKCLLVTPKRALLLRCAVIAIPGGSRPVWIASFNSSWDTNRSR